MFDKDSPWQENIGMIGQHCDQGGQFDPFLIGNRVKQDSYFIVVLWNLSKMIACVRPMHSVRRDLWD